jgi:alpha-tubulin suppressor-like RCC1 family protein
MRDLLLKCLFPLVLLAASGHALAQKVVQVASGYNHQALLREDGSVWTWGDNQSAQLGDGTKLNRASPGVVPA